MERCKRTPKTPKRFDDEAFVTPPRTRDYQQPKQASEAIKSVPEPAPTKSIIKVKLTKRESSRPIKLERITNEPVTENKDIVKSQDSIKSEELIESQDHATPIKVQDELVKLKETVKSKDLTKPKELARPKDTPKSAKPKDSLKLTNQKPKESNKVKETLKVITKFDTPDREIVSRPRTKRPRTPPVYADLIPNVILPFWDARTAAEDHEDDNVRELVHCHCGINEELGLMVQCETCLTWQHAHCLGIEKAEDAPDGYTCKACSDPKFARESMKWAYDQDWLTKGRLKQFSCDKDTLPDRDVDILRRVNNLIEGALRMHHIIHSLRIKSRILKNASDDDTDLKIFRLLWPTNYQHLDGTTFIPTVNNPMSTPASTISVIADTPDPGDIAVEAVDGPLPDIGHLDDVSAILDYVPSQPMQPLTANNDVTPNECRANLKLHIQQTEEFISMELAQIEEQLVTLEKECSQNGSNITLDSLKDDLRTMKNYLIYEN